MKSSARRVAGFGETVFSTMTQLAIAHNAINLGQGFPDFAAPDFIKEAARAAIAADINQYAPSRGRLRLRQAIAATLLAHHDLPVDPATEITVTTGATEAIFAAVLGLVDPGDEVVIFEPFYDSYVPAIQFAGGVPRIYTLAAPDWHVDPVALAACFSERTRLVIVNTPHNPTGKVFSRAEFDLIADLCRRHDAVALVDGVYEQILFDGAEHFCLATWPGMRSRTLLISSLGKTFSVTGWKTGWAVGAAPLVNALDKAHQFITYSGTSPLQEAAAAALEAALVNGYYDDLRARYSRKRDLLFGGLQQAGLKPILPRGSYFIMVDIRGEPFPDDVVFCRRLTTEIGVCAIPPSAFYADLADGAGLARFAFCKTDEGLREAIRRLQGRHLSG